MKENQTGNFMSFSVDWEHKLLRLLHAGCRLDVPPGEILAVTTPVQAIECIIQREKMEGPPFHFLVDVWYDREALTLAVHPTEDFHSVVAVPRTLLRQVLRGMLSPRETEAAILLFEGCTIRYIAVQMRITEGTVKRMIYNVYKKMGLASQVELIRDIYARLAQHAATQEESKKQEAGD